MTVSKARIPLLFAGGLAFVAVPGVFAGHPVGHSPYMMFKSMDADNDGRLTHAEYVAGSRQLFANIDANHDGQVSLAELTATYALNTDQPVTGDLAADIMAQYDANNDGQMSEAEHAAGDEAMFSKLDTNHDGWLSQTECEAGMQMRKKAL